MLPFPFFLALKYLRPKRTVLSVVTVISVLGVLLGVAILVIVMSVMTGFDNMWRDKILSFRPHLTVTGMRGVVRNESEIAGRVEQVPGIVGVAPVIETLALVHHAGVPSAPIVIGIDPERAGILSHVQTNLVDGVFSIEHGGAVIGIDEARKLGAIVGSRILVYSEVIMQGMSRDELYLPEELEVRGIFNMGMQKFDQGFVITSLDSARDLVGMEEGVRRLYVMTEDPYRFREYGDEVRRVLGAGYIVMSWNDVDRVLFEALQVEKTMMFVLLAFITVVAIFCVTNTLIVITVQKTNEIGLLKALGFPSGKIMGAFVCHGWIQCVVGIALGVGLGVLILTNMQHIVAGLAKIGVAVFPKEIYGLDHIPYEIRWKQDILLIALTVLGFCTLSSLWPAARAARMNPVDALRQD